MDYYSKREAKVMIMSALVSKGWKIFDYKADESDSMTDYFSPSSWGGIATKNGYTLLVDICKYNLSDSGKEIRKYNYNNKAFAINERIEKLTAMMNDAASTENEKASCAVLIKKEQDKAGVEPTYTVIETLPTFSFANPKGASWHIEKDGQIIAKGNGAFSVNDYDWENKNKTKAEQKAERLETLINRIEKALTDADALKAEVKMVPVKTIQVVEKEVTEITETDIKEGFTVMMKVGYTHGKNKGNKYTLTYRDEKYNKYHTFAQLSKNNKPSKSDDKRWSLSVERINELLGKGHIVVIEFVEVTEYVEKVVFVKTGRKQTVSNAPALDTPEVVTVNEETVTGETIDASNGVIMSINEEKNGIELTFKTKPSADTIKILKANGFKYIPFKWYAKQTAERLAFAESLVTPFNSVINEDNTNDQTITEEGTETNTDAQNDNVIYYEFNQTETATEEQEQEGEKMENTYIDNTNADFNSLDDIFSKFDNIEITADQKVSNEDQEFCKAQEAIYKQTMGAYDNLNEQLQVIKLEAIAHGLKYSEVGVNGTKYPKSTSFDAGFSVYDLEKNLTQIKDRFISIICFYFKGKYNVTIDEYKIQKKYKTMVVTYENIVDEITEQLGGYNFTEKAEAEIKQKLRDSVSYKNVTPKGNKIVIKDYLYIDTSWAKWGTEKIHYNSADKVEMLFNAVFHSATGLTVLNGEMQTLSRQIMNGKNDEVFGVHDLNLSNVKSIKIFKNGKVEIEFLSHTLASKFAGEYCGYSQQSA